MKYIIADTHFGHENIIEYCERPFADAREMNATMVERWNEKVGPEDTVIHLGDVRHHPDTMGASSWLNLLNGDILLVRGNHDGGVGQNNMVVENATIQHGRYTFYLEHQPVGVNGWQIHGHVHNNDVVTYPFIHPGRQNVNVSVELIGYEPLAMDRLVHLLDKKERYRDLSESPHSRLPS